MTLSALSLGLLACGAAAPRSETLPSQPTDATNDREALDVRRLDYDVEACHEQGISALWDALVPLTPAFFLDDGEAWLPGDCAFFVPEPGLFPPVPGALFVDLDGDGREEAITEVHYERRHADDDDTVRDRALLIVRTVPGAELPTITVLASELDPLSERDVTLEGFGGVRFERGVLVLAGSAGCYDCGCDLVELDYDCHTGSCTYVGHRVVDPVEDCESP